jgi:hypothetical protein
MTVERRKCSIGFRLAVELRYLAVALPKLDVVTVYELLRGFDSCIIIWGVELDRLDEMAVAANDVNSVLLDQAGACSTLCHRLLPRLGR